MQPQYEPIGTTTPPGGWSWTHDDFTAASEDLSDCVAQVIGYIVANDIDVDDPKQEVIDQTAKRLRKRDRDRYFRPFSATTATGMAAPESSASTELTPAQPVVEEVSSELLPSMAAASSEELEGVLSEELAASPPEPEPIIETALSAEPIKPIEAAVAGAKVVAKIVAGQYEFVGLSASYSRALVCGRCPHNQPASEFPRSLLEKMGAAIIRKKRVDAEKSGEIPKLPAQTTQALGVCGICKCSLVDAVRYSAATHQEFVRQFGDRLPAHCWKKKECADLS